MWLSLAVCLSWTIPHFSDNIPKFYLRSSLIIHLCHLIVTFLGRKCHWSWLKPWPAWLFELTMVSHSLSHCTWTYHYGDWCCCPHMEPESEWAQRIQNQAMEKEAWFWSLLEPLCSILLESSPALELGYVIQSVPFFALVHLVWAFRHLQMITLHIKVDGILYPCLSE